MSRTKDRDMVNGGSSSIYKTIVQARNGNESCDNKSQDNGSSSFHDQRAIFLAAVCAQTYAQYDSPEGLFVVPSPYELRHVIYAKSILQSKELFGFLLEAPDELILAFRGTSSTANWISDLLASQKKFKYIPEDCLTHRGFTAIYASARKELMDVLAKLPADKPLFITGHSLGAALATLCAADTAANTAYTSPYLYTFGSPRVGDPDFAKAFVKYVPNSWRFANPFDLVTLTPPTVYKLPKTEKRYYYSHVRTLSPMTFLNGAFGPNHMISSYFEQLAKLDPAFTQQLMKQYPGFCPSATTGEAEVSL